MERGNDIRSHHHFRALVLTPDSENEKISQSNAYSKSQTKVVAFGIAPRGIIAIGLVPMGFVAIGGVSMGIMTIGVVGMGVVNACLVGCGLIVYGVKAMGLN